MSRPALVAGVPARAILKKRNVEIEVMKVISYLPHAVLLSIIIAAVAMIIWSPWSTPVCVPHRAYRPRSLHSA